jgi:hypothetical protein
MRDDHRRFGFLFPPLIVNSEPTRLNDPQFAGRNVSGESIDQRLDENPYSRQEIVRTTKNHQAWSLFRGIAEHIGRIQIEGYQNAVF